MIEEIALILEQEGGSNSDACSAFDHENRGSVRLLLTESSMKGAHNEASTSLCARFLLVGD